MLFLTINQQCQSTEGGLNLLHEADDDAGIYSDCSTREINNNSNNKLICTAQNGRNFRSTGAKQCATENRKERSPGEQEYQSLLMTFIC